MTWASHLLNFYATLNPPRPLPGDVQWLHPQQDPKVMEVVTAFLYRYFSDSNTRQLILGINPGRFGAGVTGINFTAPKQLTTICDIPHHFNMHTELSAEFIWEMIAAFGGPERFYANYFIGSICTLGLVKQGKNINYYDDPELQEAVEPFIIETIDQQLTFPVDRSRCICIGGEKNYKYLLRLNERKKWFQQIVPVAHPRFIMQYRRKQKEAYIDDYIRVLKT